MLSYLQYSSLCAKALRRCLQEAPKREALKREESFAKVNRWQDGKQIKVAATQSNFKIN
jgi:hypothetical protein